MLETPFVHDKKFWVVELVFFVLQMPNFNYFFSICQKMSNICHRVQDRKLERKWLIKKLSLDLRKDKVHQLQQDLIEQQKVCEPWSELQFFLFPNGNIIWNIQIIVLDDVENWDGNLELVLLKEKLGLVQFFKFEGSNDNIPQDLLSHRKNIVSSLIPRHRLYNV